MPPKKKQAVKETPYVSPKAPTPEYTQPNVGEDQKEEEETEVMEKSGDNKTLERMENDIVELHRRMAQLNRKLTLTSQSADLVCPGEIIEALAKVEEETDRFKGEKEVSVYQAIAAQQAYTESLTLTFGPPAGMLYKLLRFSIQSEFRHLSRVEQSAKMLSPNHHVYKELRTVSALVWEVISDRNLASDWVISIRESVRITMEKGYKLVFSELLEMVVGDEMVSRKTMEMKVRRARNLLQRLFSDEMLGVKRLQEWMDAEKSPKFTRRQAIVKLREVFPYRMELHAGSYKLLGLREADRRIENGEIENWPSASPPGYSSDEEQLETEMEFGRKRQRYDEMPAGRSLDQMYESLKMKRSENLRF
ncbi:Oidioi.mRNA.OKI2018_I69.chr2.g8096.t1.cds [Oikopleura dioica]|uniref:Oidioi.mRNA.OKI2018_I69.chr2.g8096.t1.cds n=1 Tax=Oikopleura dioica TaxID=34765 RepID=A0ABN7TGE6_OIKDI|nr:Oidioi.mRNA.OKI2018_I69.chr2.g8096.t1.cds [Oikopleura dioica]